MCSPMNNLNASFLVFLGYTSTKFEAMIRAMVGSSSRNWARVMAEVCILRKAMSKGGKEALSVTA